jgi:3-hydroxybutyryl-CoA dehydrogenase
MAAIAHGIRTVGVIGAGQMGTGIALVSALRAKVPVKLYDKSSEQVTKGLAFMDRLLEKDVSKGRIQSTDAKEARDRVSTVNSIAGFKDVDMVIEVC